jgi:hypothetical protein
VPTQQAAASGDGDHVDGSARTCARTASSTVVFVSSTGSR